MIILILPWVQAIQKKSRNRNIKKDFVALLGEKEGGLKHIKQNKNTMPLGALGVYFLMHQCAESGSYLYYVITYSTFKTVYKFRFK